MRCMQKNTNWPKVWVGVLVLALSAVLLDDCIAQTGDNSVSGPVLTQPPVATDSQARLAWAHKESDALHAYIAAAPRDARGWIFLSSLSIEVVRSIERALTVEDLKTAKAFLHLFESRLAGTPWPLEWLAARKTASANYALGVMSLHGIMVPPDVQDACARFATAWEIGFREAAFRLARCIQVSDPARSARLMQSAAEAGNPAAHEQLGRLCLESKPMDAVCASVHVRSAANAGRPSAISLLGWMYAQGIGVDRDLAHAFKLYLEAAEAGDLSARNNLGELYETGRGVQADARRAVDYYRQAAESGFPPAQYNLGRIYAAGVLVPRDLVQARTLLQAALKAGIQPAQKLLDWLDTEPLPGRR